MKRIVNGKLYDTLEAITVCSWIETGSLFGIEFEATFTLYRENAASGNPSEGLKLEAWGSVSDWNVKKDPSKGEFFFAVEANGCGKGHIRPVSIDEARRIFEEHGTDSDWAIESDYEKYFGVSPRKTMLEQIKEAFKAGAAAKQKQYEEAEKAKANSLEA